MIAQNDNNTFYGTPPSPIHSRKYESEPLDDVPPSDDSDDPDYIPPPTPARSRSSSGHSSVTTPRTRSNTPVASRMGASNGSNSEHLGQGQPTTNSTSE